MRSAEQARPSAARARPCRVLATESCISLARRVRSPSTASFTASRARVSVSAWVAVPNRRSRLRRVTPTAPAITQKPGRRRPVAPPASSFGTLAYTPKTITTWSAAKTAAPRQPWTRPASSGVQTVTYARVDWGSPVISSSEPKSASTASSQGWRRRTGPKRSQSRNRTYEPMKVARTAEPMNQVGRPGAVWPMAYGVAIAIIARRKPKTWRHMAWRALTWMAKAGAAGVPVCARVRSAVRPGWEPLSWYAMFLSPPAHSL
ncbi:hypothetical protein SMICM17S_12230 [Streptomyces microflavus]